MVAKIKPRLRTNIIFTTVVVSLLSVSVFATPVMLLYNTSVAVFTTLVEYWVLRLQLGLHQRPRSFLADIHLLHSGCLIYDELLKKFGNKL